MVIVYADGACRGNPGPMGIGASIQAADGREIAIVSAVRGEGTNNIAEYQAAIEGLKEAKKHDINELELRMDSQLVVRQLNGEYRVRAADLKPLWTKARRLLDSFQKWSVVHVPRKQNTRADELANLALNGIQDSLGVREADAGANRISGSLRDASINLKEKTMRPVLFHDVDGVLFGDYGASYQLRPGVNDWLTWVHQNFEVIWLTAWDKESVTQLLEATYNSVHAKRLMYADWMNYCDKETWLRGALERSGDRTLVWIDDEATEVEGIHCIKVNAWGSDALVDLQEELIQFLAKKCENLRR